MASDTMIVSTTLDSGLVIRGNPGLFMPVDAWKLDQAYSAATVGDMSFYGDVEGSVFTTSSGTKVAELTIPDYENIKDDLSTMKLTMTELSGELSDVISALESLSERVDNSSVPDIAAELSALSNSVSELEGKSSAVEQMIGDINNNLSSVQQTAEMAVDEVSKISIDFDQVQQDLNSALSDVDGLKVDNELLAEELGNLSAEQKSYIRFVDNSTVDGSLVFTDGHGGDVHTVGNAVYDTFFAEP